MFDDSYKMLIFAFSRAFKGSSVQIETLLLFKKISKFQDCCKLVLLIV